MSKKLLEKAGQIQLPPVGEKRFATSAPTPTTSPALAQEARQRTAPGAMAAFLGTQSAAVKEAEDLRAEISQLKANVPYQRLDPRLIRPSKWANRSEESYSTKDFDELKAEIANAGGNIQPIKVRKISGGQGEYELVYGHRRHRACLQLGIPVLAIIEEMTDQTLFVEMERENRNRKDLSAWEQGVMYARALEKGLYPSNRKLAEAINRDVADVGKALMLAGLPSEVVAAFSSPLELQFRFAKPLRDAVDRDRQGVVARAVEIAAMKVRPGPKAVVARLTGSDACEVKPSHIALNKAGRQVAMVTKSKDGLTVQIGFSLDEQKEAILLQHLRELLGADN